MKKTKFKNLLIDKDTKPNIVILFICVGLAYLLDFLFIDHVLYPEFIRKWDTFYKGILIGFIFWLIVSLVISWKERIK